MSNSWTLFAWTSPHSPNSRSLFCSRSRGGPGRGREKDRGREVGEIRSLVRYAGVTLSKEVEQLVIFSL